VPEPVAQTLSTQLTEQDGFLYLEVPLVLETPASLPQYKSDEAACADLYALIPANVVSGMDIGSKITLQHRAGAKVKTGVKVAVPRGYKLCVAARSGLAEKGLLVSNAPGQVDSDYRGEIMLLMRNVGQEIIEVKNGDRVAQCWLERVIRIKPKIVTELPATIRGEGGFGSTGKS
jgi:dUTP pyrophosphatase